MPTVVNGIGTWYHFKRNVQEIEGRCEQCGAYSRLTSYDTTLCFVVVFIPLIPLARKRIICECSACRKHLAMPLAEYRRLQDRAVQMQQKLEQNPADEQLAKDAITACVPMRDIQQFHRIAPLIEKGQGDNADSMLLLAAAYDVFGETLEIERVLKLALDTRDECNIREAMASCLMDQNRLEEAEPYVAHIIDDVIPDRVDLLYRMAQLYQAQGKHQRALDFFQFSTEVAPAIAQDEVFVRLRTASEQALGTNTRVQPMEIVKQINRGKAMRRLGRYAKVAAVLLTVGYVLYCAYLGQTRTIYVVSGVNRQYTVTVDDQSHVLDPFSTWAFEAGEGTHTVSTKGLAVDLPPTQAVTRSSFFTRPFSDAVLVLNADRCAVLARQEVYYTENPTDHDDHGAQSCLGGDLVTVVPDIDYPFQELPQRLRLPNGKSVRKSRVVIIGSNPEVDRDQLLLFYEGEVPAEMLNDVARRRVECEGVTKTNVAVAARLLGPGKAVEFLRPRLASRPVELETHRVYQYSMEKLGKSEELYRAYQSYLAAEPDDPGLQYLLSRASADPKLSWELLQKSALADEPCPYAFTSIG